MLDTGSSPSPRRLLFPIFLLVLLFLPTLAQAQAIIKVNDDVWIRFGTQLQLWADEAQDSATKEYNQNLYIRRARVLLTGSVAKDVTFFIQTDDPNLGKSPKALGSGYILQDGWAQWKIRDEFALNAGLMLIPLNRAELVSTTSFITVDISPTATVFATPTQTSGTRDTGFEAQGYVADGRLEYRAGLFQGIRDAATTTTVASHNAFRRSVWLSYDFWEKERGYVYAGTNRGTKKVLALSGGYDAQKTYKAYSASVHSTVPVNGKDEFAVLAQGVHYDGGKFLTTLPRQNDYLAEFGYYIAPSKIQPFVKFEDQKFTVTSIPSKDQKRYGGGFNYYVYGQNLKLTGQVTHVKFSNSALHSTNELTVQMQVWYY
jgi:Phosphate-selective porin O and P